MSDPNPPPRYALGGAIGVMCVVWGTTWFVVRDGLSALPPFGSASIRFALAGVLMLGVAPLVARREGGDRPRPALVAVMALGNFAVPYGLVYWCEVVVPSALAALIWASFPLVTGAVGHVFLPNERLSARQWGGFAVGFVGVGLLFLTDLRALGPDVVGAGALLLLSPLAAALATAYVKRRGRRTSSALLNRDAMLVGAALLGLTSILFERDARFDLDGRAAAGILYLALAGTVLTFSLYFWALRHAPAWQLSLVAYVTPAFALLVGWGIGDERVTVWSVVGLATILAGVGLSTLGRRRRLRTGTTRSPAASGTS